MSLRSRTDPLDEGPTTDLNRTRHLPKMDVSVFQCRGTDGVDDRGWGRGGPLKSHKVFP